MKEKDPYKWYEKKREAFLHATSVKELLDIECEDLNPKINKVLYRQMTQRRLNKLYRGALEKSRQHLLRELAVGFDNWEEAEAEAEMIKYYERTGKRL